MHASHSTAFIHLYPELPYVYYQSSLVSPSSVSCVYFQNHFHAFPFRASIHLHTELPCVFISRASLYAHPESHVCTSICLPPELPCVYIQSLCISLYRDFLQCFCISFQRFQVSSSSASKVISRSRSSVSLFFPRTYLFNHLSCAQCLS